MVGKVYSSLFPALQLHKFLTFDHAKDVDVEQGSPTFLVLQTGRWWLREIRWFHASGDHVCVHGTPFVQMAGVLAHKVSFVHMGGVHTCCLQKCIFVHAHMRLSLAWMELCPLACCLCGPVTNECSPVLDRSPWVGTPNVENCIPISVESEDLNCSNTSNISKT